MTSSPPGAPEAPTTAPPAAAPPVGGPFARMGRAMVDNARWVAVAWAVILVGLGAFAPTVFGSLAGAGWQANGSDSVKAREVAEQHFGGNGSTAVQVVVHSDDLALTDPGVQEVMGKVTDTLAADDRIGQIIPPMEGMTISPDGRTGILIAGADADSDEMVRAVDDLKGPLQKLSTEQIDVYPTGASALWSDFNAANRDAMIKAEMVSWPVTLAIMLLAFGSLVAAGLPLMLTLAGLVASAGGLVLLNSVTPISVWAFNFAMMFALALGIDYALFVVSRFRTAMARTGEMAVSARDAVAETMDTAGKAVALSGLTVLISLSAVMIVPAPAVRTMAVGIMLAVIFVLAATLTLLPMLLGKLGHKVNAAALPWVKKRERSIAADEPQRESRWVGWGRLIDRRPWPFVVASLALLVGLGLPMLGLKVAMPSIQVVPEDAPVRQGYHLVAEQFGDGAPGTLQLLTPADQAETVTAVAQGTDDIGMVTPPMPAMDDTDWVMIQAIPDVDPSDPAMETIVADLRAELPGGTYVGGAPVENLDLQQALNDYLPLIIGVILVLGFLLLLIALQGPLIALIGTLVSLLSTAAAFGVARLIFQDGLASGLLGFDSQGFLNGWGPVFFFAMIFAIAMDYTVFLLSTAREVYEQTGDARGAQVGSMASTGRVIFAAAAVMVAVFFSFALAEPLPPKEMGVILGVAVLLDGLVVRLALLPALLRLFGDAAWWSPRWLRKALPNITFTH